MVHHAQSIPKLIIDFQDNDGKISFDEFCQVVKNTDIHTRMVVEV